MYKMALFLLVTTSVHLFAFSDSDMDGVEDALDKCPGTPLSELVDKNGCTTESLYSESYFDIIYGLSFSQNGYDISSQEKTDTLSQSLQVDYYYQNFSLQASTSYYNSQSTTYNGSGSGDSFLGAYYKLTPSHSVIVRLGVGLILPTYSSDLYDNKTDYTASLSVSYAIENINIFGGYAYTIINDESLQVSGKQTTQTVEYVDNQNTNAYSVGIGFDPSEKLYLSTAYNSSESIYSDVGVMETVSLNAFYNLDENWFTTATYAYGLSDSASDNYVSLRLGYYF